MTDIFIKSGETNNKIYVTSNSTKYFSEKSEEAAQKARNEADRAKEIVNNAQNQITSAGIQQTNLAIENIQVAAESIKNTVVDEIQLEGSEQVNLAKAEVAKATTQATNAANSASQAKATLNSATTTINTEKTNAVNAVKAQQNSSVNTVKATGQSYINKCKDWASSDRVVEGGLYSAKHYAEMAQGKSDVTYEHLRASRVYNDKGMLLTDEEGYADVEGMNRSTFDLSKFTVVGTPTITEDGVASFPIADDYVDMQLSSNVSSTWKIKTKFTTGTALDAIRTIFHNYLPGVLNNRSEVFLNNNKLAASITLSDGNYIAATATGSITVTTNTTYWASLSFDGASYTFEYSTDGITWKQIWKIPNTDKVLQQKIRIGNTAGLDRRFNGSIDLKHFSITVDGREVFNGNKTGLDIIKPDNYAVVGSPVITSDGIASGFGEKNNFVVIPCSLPIISGQNIVYRFLTTINYKKEAISQALFWFYPNGSKNRCMYLSVNTKYGITNALHDLGYTESTDIFTKDGLYNIEYETDLSSYYKVYVNGVLYNNATFVKENLNSTLTEITIGATYDGATFNKGSIDLNSFKIYVDGNLVYQPCLKIPYNLSKTGSKIVSAYARERAIDLYEQEGSANLFTIDEENKNFTLPMGELYGFIGQRALKSTTSTSNSKVDIYSDKTCLICGTVTTAGAVNLPIELANANYFVTLPTSNKNSTSFTTTATGDYILIGKVV